MPETLAIMQMLIDKGLANVHFDKLGAQYILVKHGIFTYSLDKKLNPIPDIYWARYTVTNHLYRQFISYLDTKGTGSIKGFTFEHYAKHLSAEAALIEGFSDYLHREKSLAKLFASKYDEDWRFKKSDQPVLGVTFYSACAYCMWLSLMESNGQDDHIYRLPTEMEWEFAAAGENGRQYPWSKKNGEPTNRHANYDQNEGCTTPVGRYPEGATPDGLNDMAGNVWEWVDSPYEGNSFARVLRGGCWCDPSDVLCCTARNGYLMADGYGYIGFRVVRSSASVLNSD